MQISTTDETIAFVLDVSEAQAILAKLEGRLGDLPPRSRILVEQFAAELDKFA